MPGLLNVPGTLSQQDLSDIITLPAQDVGLRFQPGLVEQIVTDVLAVTPDMARQAPVTVLPLLELALSQLWSRREDGYLTHEAYRRIGAVSGSLTTWCDNTLSRLPSEQHPIARRILTSLVHPEDPGRNVPAVRAQLPLDELRDLAADPDDTADGHVDDVIGVLTLHRIITTQMPRPREGPDAPRASRWPNWSTTRSSVSGARCANGSPRIVSSMNGSTGPVSGEPSGRRHPTRESS